MRAWRLEEIGAPLVLCNVAPPGPPGPGRLVVEVAAAGLCHSDVSFVDGTIASVLAPLPLTLGHEIAGTVTAVGAGVSVAAPGDRVGVRAGVRGAGVAFDGGFADLVAVPEEFVVRLPAGLPFDLAAVATDAGKSSYHAMVCRGRVGEATRVGLIGLGGLGDVAAQIALARGAVLHVAEPDPAKRERAAALGAAAVAADVTAFAEADLEVIVDFAGIGTTTAAAVEIVRPGGRVVQVGLARARAEIDVARLTLSSIDLLGSSNGGHEDMAAVLELMGRGAVAPLVEHVGFDDIGLALDRLTRGGVSRRLVAMLDPEEGKP